MHNAKAFVTRCLRHYAHNRVICSRFGVEFGFDFGVPFAAALNIARAYCTVCLCICLAVWCRIARNIWMVQNKAQDLRISGVVDHVSEGGVIRLETLTELNLFNSSLSNSQFSIRAFRTYP